jgi:parallel beta-helix repeat protein/predicted outer membrane repeat protein
MVHRHRFLIGTLVAVALAVLVLIAPGGEGAIAQGGIIYVDAGATGANNGTSWADAFTALQPALDAAGPGDQIWVAEGTYKPTWGFSLTDPRSATFQMKNGVALYGGFAGTESSLTERDWVTHVTILSGDLNGDDVPPFGNNGENSYHVFYHPEGTNLDSTAILDGFTISGGNANITYVNQGGGMYNDGSSPTLSNCTFSGNAADHGGGMWNYRSSSPTLTNCTFVGNSALQSGGGMLNGSSSPTLTNCTFSGNSAGNSGGGMANGSASPALTNCTFSGNSATYGGGMANSGSPSPTLTNCTFSGNSASALGGGIYSSVGSATLTNCTFSGNSAPNGGGIYNYYSTPTLTNSILWGDSPEEISNSDLFLSPLVTYSDVQGGHPGDGNIDADPQFVDPASGDYHLGPHSPCIDAGNNDAPYLPEVDFEGELRIVDGDSDGTAIVDMGVDEAYSEPPPPPPDVIFVDAEATGANTGTSWADAFTTLQPALSWAVDGVEIWVAEGTYKPTGGTDRTVSFRMKNGVAIYGGFDPSVGVTEFEDRDWVAHATILSGDIGTEGDVTDNSYHVFYHPEGTALDGTAVLDGLTISGGTANGDYPHHSGGGMYNYASSPTLNHVTFTGNGANYYGGGMYNDHSAPALTNCIFSDNSASRGEGGGISNSSSSPVLTNCTFSGNSASVDGGGMANFSSSPVLTDCTFVGNSASVDGGGMYNDGSSPTLSNCTFSGNTASFRGGAMCNHWYSSPVLTNCTFSGNSADGDGGAMYNGYGSSPALTDCTFADNSAIFGGGMYSEYYSTPVLTDCSFLANSALDSGGGMWNSNGTSPVLTNCTFDGNAADHGGGMNNSSSSPTLTNCLFSGNTARAGSGGGIYNWDSSSPVLTNCTFAGNSAVTGGGVFNHFNSSAALTNCIVWGNSPDQIANDSSTPVVTYCDVQGGYEGEGNINADPLFVDATGGDFHLGPDSPCIDVGSNEAPYLPLTDFEGDDRILDGDGDGTAIVDMGVDEVVYTGPTVIEVEIDIRPDSDQNVINLGSGGVVPVAILTTGEFDAGAVRPASVRFAGAAPRRWTMEDVDRDGDEDLLLFFKIKDLELDASSIEATLAGETFPHAGAVLIEGTDGVRIVP